MSQESVYIKPKFSIPKPTLGEIPLYVGVAIYVGTMGHVLSSIFG